MTSLPHRNIHSLERAKRIFRRFSRSRWEAMSVAHNAALLGVAVTAGGASVLIEAQRRFGSPLTDLVPMLSYRTAGFIAVGMLILSVISTYGAKGWNLRSPHRLPFAVLPLFNFTLLKQDQPLKQDLPIEGGQPATIPRSGSALEIGFFKKPHLWSRFESSLAAPLLQVSIVPLIFIFLACSMARFPPGSYGRSISYGLQVYAALAATLACYRFEVAETRGTLRAKKRIPIWPIAVMPWGLGWLAPLLLASKSTPEGSISTMLFFDRRQTPRYQWEFLRGQLPRLRESKLQSTGDILKSQSFLRAHTAILSLQMIAVGLLAPYTFNSLMKDLIASCAIILVILAGLLLKNIKQSGKATRISVARLLAAWSALALGSTCFGFLVGSGLSSRSIVVTNVYLMSVGLLLTAFSGLIFMIAAGRLGEINRDIVWLPVLLSAATIGIFAGYAPVFRSPLEEGLVFCSIVAWLIPLPVGLLYQDLFLAPFTVRDLWHDGLPKEMRRRLLLTSGVLLLPLGGIACARLAFEAQRRDERLQLWWKTQKQIEHSLKTRLHS